MSYEELERKYEVNWDFTYDGDVIKAGTRFIVYFRADYVRYEVDTDRGVKEEYEVEISAEWVERVAGPPRYKQRDNGVLARENYNFLLDLFREQAIESMSEEVNS
jgi:hypothetical protein